MSALVILECNGCTAISPPYASAEKAREAEAPDGWTVAIDGADLDYCPKCTAPAVAVPPPQASEELAALVEEDADRFAAEQLRVAKRAVALLGDLCRVIAHCGDRVPLSTLRSTALLGALRADETLRELEK